MLKRRFEGHSILPEELNSDMPIIYIFAQNRIKILNYQKILYYNPMKMVLLLKKRRLIIEGSRLDIDYFNEDEICIRGHIVSLTYQGE